MTAQDLPALSIADLQLLLRRREVSPREVIDALRARIEVVDGDIGAYLSLDMDAATNEADKANVDPVRRRSCRVIAPPMTRPSFGNCAQRVRFHLEKPTWTSSPWVRPPKIPR